MSLLGEIIIPAPSQDDVQPDVRAENEGIATATGMDLSSKQTDSAIKRLRRDDGLQDTLYLSLRILVICVAILIILSITTLVLHFILPATGDGFIPRRWLEIGDVESLKDFLLSGAVGAGLASLGRRVVGQSSNGDDEAHS